MERSFVLVLTLMTIANATPHGYGAKGDAPAKAEARAVAGAFGDLGPVPLSIPSGPAYSGSFSKSSSSSFASSSASASSSSYSFSGSSANGAAGIGAGKGCTPGTCPGVGANGPSTNGLTLGGANAFAAAQAKAVSGSYTPCQGSNCSPDEKCTSGQCSTDSELKEKKNGCSAGTCQSGSDKETPSSEVGSGTDCSSGQCDRDKQEGDNDSNDFAVNIHRNSPSKQSHDLSGQYSNKGRSYNSGPGCSNGRPCNPTNPYPNIHYQQPAPSSYLTTPNENPPCTTPDCNNPSQGNGPETGGLPSSYNVPIQSATNPPNTLYSPSVHSFGPGSQTYPNAENTYTPDAPCTSPGCSSYNTGSSNIPKNYFGQQGQSNQGLCASGRCSSGPGSGVKSPNYSHGSSPSNVPPGHTVQPGCKTPNCAEFPSDHTNGGSSTGPKYATPTNSNLPTNQPDKSCGGTACSVTTHVGLPTKPTESNAPTYSGGFGGPAGFLDTTPGGNNLPLHSTNHYGSNYTPGTSGPIGAFGSTPTHGSYGTTKPNESPANHYVPSQTHGSNGNTGAYGSAAPHGSFEITKPNQYNPANHYTPSTSGPAGAYGSTPFHGSFGTTNTNELNSNGLTQTTSNGGSTGVFGYNKPSGKPATADSQSNLSGNLGASTLPQFMPLGAVTHPENGLQKPTTPDNNLSAPAYSGGIEGYPGSSNTNSGYDSVHGSFGISKPSPIPSAQSSPTSTGGFAGPTGTADGTSTTYGSKVTPSSGDCGSAGCHGQPPANGNDATTSYDTTKSGTANSSEKKPAYNRGFGAPTGFLKPNDFSILSPALHSGNTPCSDDNCGPKDNPSASHGHGSSLSGAQSLASATASANAVAYSGGFGGPPGVLKPFDDGKVNSPVQGNLGSEHGPSNTAHPDAPTVNGKDSIPGSYANGANSGAHASASASAVAGSHNGGNNYQNKNGGAGGCNSGCGSNGDGVNNGFPDGLVKNGLRAGSVASAKSIAGANAFGFGGSYASSSASAQASAGTKGGYGRK